MGTAESMTEGLPEISIPNTPHGLREVSMGSCRIHTPPTMKASTAYLTYLRIRSIPEGRARIRNIFRERKKKNSCADPNAHRYPQKKRPQTAVTKSVTVRITSCEASAPREKVPAKAALITSPSA